MTSKIIANELVILASVKHARLIQSDDESQYYLRLDVEGNPNRRTLGPFSTEGDAMKAMKELEHWINRDSSRERNARH